MEHNVYVHCIGGIGRTGITVACYLIRHGMAGQQALVELQVLRQNVASWYRRSPESDLQIEFVEKWGDQ
jgi:protein-tyrosine phosphatase